MACAPWPEWLHSSDTPPLKGGKASWLAAISWWQSIVLMIRCSNSNTVWVKEILPVILPPLLWGRPFIVGIVGAVPQKGCVRVLGRNTNGCHHCTKQATKEQSTPPTSEPWAQHSNYVPAQWSTLSDCKQLWVDSSSISTGISTILFRGFTFVFGSLEYSLDHFASTFHQSSFESSRSVILSPGL